MLLKQHILEGIVAGQITLAFRRWTKPTVKTGGTLKTRLGVLAIDQVLTVAKSRITREDARNAGYPTKAELLKQLDCGKDGKIYRVELRYAGEDPRVAVRENTEVTADELTKLSERFERMDASSRTGSWVMETLELIAARPAIRAPELAAMMNMETKPFKTNVRKLKTLGLTVSLDVGYRLSPRGEVVHARLQPS